MTGEAILDKRVWGILCMEGTFEVRLGKDTPKKHKACGVISKYEDPKVETNLMYLRNRKTR